MPEEMIMETQNVAGSTWTVLAITGVGGFVLGLVTGMYAVPKVKTMCEAKKSEKEKESK